MHKKYIFIFVALLVILAPCSAEVKNTLLDTEQKGQSSRNEHRYYNSDADNFLSGGSMLQENNVMSRVTAGTANHNDRAFGFVTEWLADAKPAKIKLSDGSEWFIADDKINMYRMLIEYSRDYKEPILLAVNNKFQTIGMIFSTMVGVPELNGETKNGKAIQVSVPPSTQMFRLRKDRPWFNAVKTAIIEAQNLPYPTESQYLYVAFDSVENEIVDVHPASN